MTRHNLTSNCLPVNKYINRIMSRQGYLRVYMRGYRAGLKETWDTIPIEPSTPAENAESGSEDKDSGNDVEVETWEQICLGHKMYLLTNNADNVPLIANLVDKSVPSARSILRYTAPL
jgi:hypothetical protein